MADIHLLDRTAGVYRVVLHIPLPGTDNSAGIPWRTAYIRRHGLANEGAAPSSILPDGDGAGGTISAAEKAQVAAAEVIEETHDLALESDGDSLADINRVAQDLYARRSTALLAAGGELDEALRQYGRTADAS